MTLHAGMRQSAVLLWLLPAPLVFAQAIPSFTGADGAGAFATGGRGGVVYHVTKLDQNYSDNVPGTLRYGLTDSNFNVGGVVQPRTIVFDVAGTFWLGRYGADMGHDNGWDTQSRYNSGSNVTIAGQTAPGPVNIMGGVTKANGTNVVIRNVTFAPGYGMRNFSQPDAGIPPTPGDFPDSYVYDAIDISGTNIMIDHVSTFYATDETISANETANNVTIQYSNISQGQNYPQADAEASSVTYTGHALGSLFQGGSGDKLSVHHNLYADQKGRLPRVGSEVGTGAYNDFRNNVFYNWLGTGGTGAGGQPSFNNFVGNFWLAGPGGDNVSQTAGSDGKLGTLDDSAVIVHSNGGTSLFSGSNSSGTRVYQSSNVKDTNKDGDPNDGLNVTNSDFGSSSFQASPQWSGGTPTYTGVTDTASQAFERVLDYMGADWWTRDGVVDTPDERMIQEVRTGTGKIVAWADDPFNSDPNEGVEWRSMLALRADTTTGAAPFTRPANWDVDGDGMPGDWELAHGLNPNATDNNGDFDSDGYTNLEEYLNDVAAWPAAGPVVFNGATNNRYAQITNWDSNPDPAVVGVWQPSRYDTAVISSGTAVVDAVGQHAGTLAVAPNAGNVGALQVTAGWIEVADTLNVGSGGVGTVDHSGGTVAAESVHIGGGVAGNYSLTGNGWLRAGTLSEAANGSFNFTGGTLSADIVEFDLRDQGGVISPGDGAGQTHVVGNLVVDSGSILIELGGAGSGQFDKLLVDGSLTAGGTLAVSLVGGFSPSTGDVFDILHFTSVTGSFQLELPALHPGLTWNTSALLTTGELTVAPSLGADFNGDGTVDGADFLVWQRGFGLSGQMDRSGGDANGDGVVNASDLTLWQSEFGVTALGSSSTVVPEPSSWLLVILIGLAWMEGRLPSRRRKGSGVFCD